MRPAIGQLFTLRLDCTAYPDLYGMTFISMHARGMPATPTRYGELLIDLTSPRLLFLASIQIVVGS